MDFRLFDVRTPRYITRPSQWPDDLRWIVEAYLQDQDRWTKNDNANIGASSLYSSPRFFVTKDNKLLGVAVGLNGWQYDIVPLLNRVVGA